MKLNYQRKKDKEYSDRLSAELPDIESVLETTFKPITPRPDFVNALKSRLEDPVFINQRRKLSFQQSALVLVALTTTVFMALGIVKLIIELISAFQNVVLFGSQAGKELPENV